MLEGESAVAELAAAPTEATKTDDSCVAVADSIFAGVVEADAAFVVDACRATSFGVAEQIQRQVKGWQT